MFFKKRGVLMKKSELVVEKRLIKSIKAAEVFVNKYTKNEQILSAIKLLSVIVIFIAISTHNFSLCLLGSIVTIIACIISIVLAINATKIAKKFLKQFSS